jgi:hypothetical protein
MPAESTLKQYSQRIVLLAKAGINAYTSPASLFKWFEDQKLSPSSQKLYLSALKNNDPDKFSKQLQDRLNSLYTQQNAKDMTQTLNESQMANFVDWTDILALQDRLRTSPMSRAYLIVSLYTLNNPVRADYGAMEVFPRMSATRTGNELIWGKNPKFVFRVYKTAKTYGTVVLPVSAPLKAVIQAWFDSLGGTPKYLLGDRSYSSTIFARMVADTFETLLKKPVGVSLLRHSFITHIYPTLKTIAQKEAVAKSMLHSRDLQEKYRVI